MKYKYKRIISVVIIISLIIIGFLTREKRELQEVNNKIQQESFNAVLANGAHIDIMLERLYNSIDKETSQQWEDPYYKIQLIRNFIDVKTSLTTFNFMIQNMPNIINNDILILSQDFTNILINEYQIHFESIGKANVVNIEDKLKTIELKERLYYSNFPIHINDLNKVSWEKLQESFNLFINWQIKN